MNQTKALVSRKDIAFTLAKFFLLLGIATVAPLIRQQAITGPIVNATLFISAVFLGAQNAILIGLIPSLVALSVGFLPVALTPIIPFIMMGNTILILAFDYFKNRNYWAGVVSASLLKSIFLIGSSSIVIKLIIKEELVSRASIMMSWPQFLTALSGGLIAYLFLKNIKKTR